MELDETKALALMQQIRSFSLRLLGGRRGRVRSGRRDIQLDEEVKKDEKDKEKSLGLRDGRINERLIWRRRRTRSKRRKN